MYNALTHLWLQLRSGIHVTVRVLCTIIFVDVFNRLIQLKILFLIHVEQLSTTALANIKLALYGVPFSHLFTELQISAIDLQISPNEL